MEKAEKGYYVASGCFIVLTILLWLIIFPYLRLNNGKKGIEAYYEQDYVRVIKYCVPAAERGDAESQYILGCCKALGVSESAIIVSEAFQDEKAAIEWWGKAARRGHENAKFMLELYNDYGVPISKVVATNPEAAKRGDAVAQKNLGVCYAKGYGVLQSWTEAVKWYRKSAEQGYASAQFNLGRCYAKGYGVLQSWTEAVKWYRKAAEQGEALAQLILGGCYEKGIGVSQSWAEAAEWYRKAAEQGDTDAKEALKRLGY